MRFTWGPPTPPSRPRRPAPPPSSRSTTPTPPLPGPMPRDGWLEHDSGQIASGGDGPDISGPGYEVLTHLILFQTEAVSAATTGRAQLTGRE